MEYSANGVRWNRIEQRFDFEPQITCEFGITEIGAAIGGLLADAGIGAAIAAPVGAGVADALGGAALGAGLSGLTGGNPLTGALTGGLTAGTVGALGPTIGAATGLGTVGGDVLAGTGAGALGAAITGGNPLLGAATGGASGLLAGVTSGAGSSSGPGASVAPAAASGAGGGTSAISTGGLSAPAGAAPMDLTGSDFSGGGEDFTPGGGSGIAGVGPAVDAGAGAPSSGLSGTLNSLFGKIPTGALLGGGLLGADLLLGNKPLPAEKQLQKAADEASSVGRTLSSYIFSGTLPPGAQQAVSAATNAAKARIRANFAQLGLSGSTMEAQALEQVDQAAAAQTFQFANQLLAQGANYSQISDQLLAEILKSQEGQQSDFTKALGTFAAGLAGAKFGSS